MNYLLENIKCEYLNIRNKILLFSGSPIIKCDIKLINVDKLEKKKINYMINIDDHHHGCLGK